MEKALKLSAQNFFDTENDLLCITKDFKDFDYVSKKWEVLLGWSHQELNSRALNEIVHPEDLEKTFQAFEEARQKKKIFGFENRLITKNKTIKCVEWRLYEDEEDLTFICLGRDISELKEKDHFLKLSQSQTSLGTWRFYSSEEKFVGSDEFFNILGTENHEPISYARNASFYDETSWSKFNSAFMNCLETGTGWDMELELISDKGSLKWIQSWGFPIRLGKEIIGVEGIIRDYSKIRNKEMLLKQTVEELDKFQLSINQHCLVARLNPHGYFMDVNKLAEITSGFRLAEFIGRHYSEFTDSSGSEVFEAIMDHLRKGGKIRREFRLRNKARDVLWVDTSLTPILNLAGELEEIVCIGYDITEKKLNDERYQTVISGINAGIWDWPDVSKDHIYWSPKFFELLGYDSEDISPTRDEYIKLIHPEDRLLMREKLEHAMVHENSFLMEYRILCGNGKYIWIQALGVILRDEKGQAYRLIGSITDINQKKLYEFNLEEEKQKTIQNSKLATLGEMAAGLAHEVNNPLTIIFGYIRILEEELLSHENNYEVMLKHVGLIKNAAQRAAKIVTNLKDFARDGSGDPFLDLPASQLISAVLDLCNERFKKNGIRLELDIVNDPNVYCRKIELSQVLLNLLFNAFDAIEEIKEKWVKITAKEHKQYVEICIIDCGPGIPSDIAEKIFMPFFTTKKVGLGTGIGLSISQRIVLNHGGELFYDSSSNNTKFVVRLPFHENL